MTPLRSVEMKNSVSSLALAALALTAVSANAQSRPAARVTPYVGFLAAGSIAQGPFGFQIGNAGAPVYGVQLGLNLTPNIALVGNVGYSDSELEAGLPIIGGIGLADSKVLMYDGGLQLRLPAVTISRWDQCARRRPTSPSSPVAVLTCS